MRVKKFPESGPKRRLLDAAEVLFAERGFEAVSVRDITGLAEANVAALNYHFGSREEIIDLLLIHHLNPLLEERVVRLETVEKRWSGKHPPLEEVIEAHLRPLQSCGKKSTLSDVMMQKLLGKMFAMPCKAMPPVTQQLLLSAESCLIRVLSKSLPTISNEELAWRVHLVEGAMIQLLLGKDSLRSSTAQTTREAAIGRLIRFSMAGLKDGLETMVDEPDDSQAQTIFQF